MKLKTNILVGSVFICFAVVGILVFYAYNETIVKIEPSSDIAKKTQKALTKQEIIPQNESTHINQSISEDSSCLDSDGMFNSSKMNLEKKEEIVKVLKQFNVTNSSRKVIDSVLVISGIGVYKGHRLLRNDDLKNVVELTQRNITSINSSQTRIVKELIKNNDINSFIALYSNKTLSPNKRFLISGKAYTPLKMVLTFFIKNKGDYTRIIEIINKMVDAGVPIQFSDIVEYTAKGAPTEVLQTLSDNFLGDINQTFFYEKQIHTLVTLSVKKSVIDSISFWLSENINPSPLKYRPNATDYVTTYKKGAQLEETVSLLLDYKVIPNKSSTFDFLNKNLSNEYQQKNLDSNKKKLDLFNYEHLTLEETNVRNDIIGNIFSIATRDLMMKSDCSISIESMQNLVRQIFSFTDVSENNNTPIAITQSEVVQRYKKLKAMESQPLTDEETDVINKESLTSKDEEEANRQVQLLKDVGWKKFLDERFEKVEISDKNKLEVSFAVALMVGASSKDLIELIEKGAEVNPDLLRSIIKTCSLEVLKSLYTNGYDFHHVYSDGTNAVSVAVRYKKIENLNFLITAGVNVNTKENPLDIAVIGLPFDPFVNIKIIDVLINAGTTITDLHKKEINSFASNNLNLYLTLINKHPELKM